MLLGVPNEIKRLEHRVGLTPDSVRELTTLGHQVRVEAGAGLGIDFSDEQYTAAGAQIVATHEEAFDVELIVKVKEPQPSEIALLRPGQTLFTYLHLAADRGQAEGLVASGAWAIAYETVTAADGSLPLLRPMSEVAGRMAVHVGAHCLQKASGGRGLLLGGVPGVPAAEVLIIGGGTAGFNAAQMAVGMQARVTLFDTSINRLEELDALFKNQVQTIYSTRGAIATAIQRADLVIGAVLIPGAAAPKLITRDMLKTMPKGAVLVDIAIDQGGCFETSKPTTHDEPFYVVDDIVHYCVANMPGAVPRTSTVALSNRTLPFVIDLADKGPRAALKGNPHLMNGLNIAEGHVTHSAVARDLGLPYRNPHEIV